MRIRSDRYLPEKSFKEPNRASGFFFFGGGGGQVIPQTGPAIAKVSFQVIDIWFGQREFPFKTSQVIISSVASNENTLKIFRGNDDLSKLIFKNSGSDGHGEMQDGVGLCKLFSLRSSVIKCFFV